MNSPHTPSAPGPDRRPYGMVPLTAPVPPAVLTNRPGGPGSSGGHSWRVTFPLLSIDALRGRGGG